MFKNYFTVAIRNLKKHKAYSLINLLGLAIGLACCILIALYIMDELNYDRFHSKWQRIYRVVETQSSPDQGERKFAVTVAPLAPTLVDEFPEVENAARLVRFGRMTVHKGPNRFYEEFLSVDPGFFEIFDFTVVQGSLDGMDEPYACVLTRTMAHKYFGDENPVGQPLPNDRGEDFHVIAVLDDIPHNSHLQFDMLISLTTLTSNPRFQPFFERWDVEGFQTYVLLDEQNSAARVEAKLPALLQQHQPADMEVKKTLTLQPLADVHFYSENIEAGRNANKGDIAYVYIFGGIALFIVLIACINYMNLATARSINRANEVGLRKVVGAQQKQLINQFLSESMVMTVIALLLAYVVVQNVLPYFNAFTEKELALGFSNSGLLLGLVVLALIVGLLSGSYPAFYLSGIRVINVLKGKLKARSGASALRRGLVVTQFVLSITMIVATLVAFKQMNYVKNKRLGFNENHLVVIDINSGEARRNFQAIRQDFLQGPGVEGVSVSSRVPGEWKNIVEIEAIPEGANEAAARTMNFFGVDENFLNTFDVTLLAGRNFHTTMSTDTNAVLLNEAAVEAFGWEQPIGRTFRVPDEEFDAHVIGVVRDFHFRSLHEKIGPLALGHSHNPIHRIDYFTARISGENIAATLDHLRSVHERYDAITPFEYHFLDQQIENFYRADRRVSILFAIAGGLAIFIACLGLFGLAAFTAEQRTKEIGVRKVLGASIPQLIVLLSTEFTKLVALALLLAAPIAFYAMNQWLAEFAYHTQIGLATFLLAGLIALTIAWLTVSYQAIKAALANPVDSLRYE